jgi:hypothetical protein
MRVSDIKVTTSKKWCQLQALVTADTLDRPFLLYYRFPPKYENFIDASIGDPFLAMLLVPAMSSGEKLEIHAQVSPKLMEDSKRIQQIFSSWNRGFSRIEVKAPICRNPHPAAHVPRVGLNFSCGIDSFYSLLQRHNDQELASITDLIVICGFDISHNLRSARVYRRLLDESSRVAREFGIRTLPVVTNARELTDMYAHTSWSSGGFLASIGLALQKVFGEIIIAASDRRGELVPWGSHPEVDPLWSTESLKFVHDGCEASRLDKTRVVSKYPLVMETLRVCSQTYSTLLYSPKLYNCGMCEKCMRTMAGLYIARKLHACRTLPHVIDIGLLRNTDRRQSVYYQTMDLVANLGSAPTDQAMKSALLDSFEPQEERQIRRRLLRTGTYLVTRYAPHLMQSWRLTAGLLMRLSSSGLLETNKPSGSTKTLLPFKITVQTTAGEYE